MRSMAVPHLTKTLTLPDHNPELTLSGLPPNTCGFFRATFPSNFDSVVLRNPANKQIN